MCLRIISVCVHKLATSTTNEYLSINLKTGITYLHLGCSEHNFTIFIEVSYSYDERGEVLLQLTTGTSYGAKKCHVI